MLSDGSAIAVDADADAADDVYTCVFTVDSIQHLRILIFRFFPLIQAEKHTMPRSTEWARVSQSA